MSPLLSLPTDVLLAIPWEDSDKWSLVLTCRFFNQLFTPTLYKHFKEDFFGVETRCPEHWGRSLGFLRTVRNNVRLGSYVHELSLALSSGDIEDWNHERFRRLASTFGVSPEFQIEALPESTNDQEEIKRLKEGDEDCNEEDYSSKDAAGNDYTDWQFMVDFARSIIPKLPQLRRMTMDYSCEVRLFDRTPHFPHLTEVNIETGYILHEDPGDKQFDDALRLLSLPKLRKWSLSCAAVQRSSVRCVPPRSSCVQQIKIRCPNIPAKDFDYLLSIPRTLKTFHWAEKAWTCHETLADDETIDDESLEDGSLGDVKCQTISVVSTISSLRRACRHLEDMTLEYAFVGICPHADSRSGNLEDFERLKMLKISPQVLRGFHRCSSQEMCVEECSYLRHSSEIITRLPLSIHNLELWMQVDGDVLADIILQLGASRAGSLERITLRSVIHCHNIPQYDGDAARLHVPMTSQRYHKIRTVCSSYGVNLDSCCYRGCFQNIAKSTGVTTYRSHLPLDIAIDEAAVWESWHKMGRLQRTMIELAPHERADLSDLQA